MARLKIKKLVLSLILSLILIVTGYFVNNMTLFTGENLDQYYLTQKLCSLLGVRSSIDRSDAFMVNVSYDKELITLKGDDSDKPYGNAAITDRSKLYRLLKLLKEQGEYKYIILDVVFDPDDVSSADTLLFPLIKSMDNIVIIRDDEISAPDESLKSKSAYADYRATITATNFTRYRYLAKNDAPYIPLKVYEDLHDVEFKRHGLSFLPFYSCGGRLCYNSCFIAFDDEKFDVFSASYEENAPKNYYNLTSDLLEDSIFTNDAERQRRILNLSKGKYVIIGNFTEDVHDTYMGLMPGSLIIYKALKTLEEGRHIVTFWQMLYWFVIFTLVFYGLLTGISMGENMTKYKFLGFLATLLSYATVLVVFSAVEYIAVKKIYSLILPSLVFFFTKLIVDYNKFKIS